ncbi:MAG: ATP-binding cassette domain-containing protein [Clostridia bacterium]|nr:ATP-binding cassette domain-containing protein [Clostridia bacterium]
MEKTINRKSVEKMNAIEIKNLSKSFRGMYAVDHLNMTVPVGAIYGFIGENGSGKSTTEKLICGHLVPDQGEIKLFGKDYTDPGVRVRVGALIENAGCFPNSSVYQNLRMQTINLGLQNPNEEIDRVLKIVRMEDSANIKFKSCSLGMKQRIGIAMALLGDPALLILDEPINGLDTDGMSIMREILVDITKNYGCTVLISSHILGELEKIATHYGIIRQGKMIMELSAEEMDSRAQVFVSLKTKDMHGAKAVLAAKFADVREEDGYIRVYDVDDTAAIVHHLMKNGHVVSEIKKNKIGLEEYYIELMSAKEEK